MGDKAAARTTMTAAGVPVTPGSDGVIADAAEAEAVARRIGLPVMVKAAAGGGGKGIRIVKDVAELHAAVRQAQAEAQAAFGNGAVYVEKYIAAPRHIEIQVLADGKGHGVHLGERDCSIQRRHQKLIEEAPSPAVTPELRRQMGEAAVAAAVAAHYEGAGTVEFLLDADGSFYFMEMNTRVQVEHCVTEMVTGIDIVKTGIRIAAGEGLPIRQEDVRVEGHAIEFRINAEDPADDFMPSPGVVTPVGAAGRALGAARQPRLPGLHGAAVLRQPARPSSSSGGATATSACARSRWALDQFLVDGVKTMIPFHRTRPRAPALHRRRRDARTSSRTTWADGAGLAAACAAAALLLSDERGHRHRGADDRSDDDGKIHVARREHEDDQQGEHDEHDRGPMARQEGERGQRQVPALTPPSASPSPPPSAPATRGRSSRHHRPSAARGSAPRGER